MSVRQTVCLLHFSGRPSTPYETCFEKEYGFLRPIIKDMTSGHHEAHRAVVIRRLGCGDPRCGFARIRRPDCGYERLLMFSCRAREERRRSLE